VIGSVTGEELLAQLDDAQLFIVDVREPDEVADWQIPGAHNIPLASLEANVGEVPRDRELVLVCAKGLRARQGAEWLAEHGIASRVLDGGMASWSSTYDQVVGDLGGATVVQLRRRGKGCLSYLVGAGTRAAVIDPSLDLSHYLEIAEAKGWSITHVLDTHLHADHLSGARQLVAETGGSCGSIRPTPSPSTSSRSRTASRSNSIPGFTYVSRR